MHRIALISLTVALAAACAHRATPPPHRVVVPAAIPSHLSNPQRIEGELIVHLSDIQPLTGPALAEANSRLGLPADHSPELHIWSSQIVERDSQRDVVMHEMSPPPSDALMDPENGNMILHWDLSGDLTPGGEITVRRRFSHTCWEVDFDIDPDSLGEPDRNSALHRRFTRSERLIECDDPRIQSLAAEIVGDETNPLRQAERIFVWVCDHMEYVYPPGERGTLPTLERLSGDCGEYAFLFIALCRAVDIPARLVSGFTVGEETFGSHAWAEFHLPGVGWVPADPSVADSADGNHDLEHLFTALPPNRLIASVGTNIPLTPPVDWATWENSEVNRDVTDFMQLWSQARCGFEATVETARRVISRGPLETAQGTSPSP
ncbi:transglutaminase domain-containing protein [Candidatus Sumerlaeota bacterium]|nr:transglutaminase domain-containing protein [Candidatus Sumerlaeota bacterium]